MAHAFRRTRPGPPGSPFLHYLRVNIPSCDGQADPSAGDAAIQYIPSYYVEDNGDGTFTSPPEDPTEANFHVHQVEGKWEIV